MTSKPPPRGTEALRHDHSDRLATGTGRGYASPPCLAGDIAPDYFDPHGVDPQQAVDVARWRKAERGRLLAARNDMIVASRQAAAASIAQCIRRLISPWLGADRALVLSAYWPIKAEPNLRALMTGLHREGVIIALPVVEIRAAPLVFRRWTPQTLMERGDWNIPVPPTTAERVNPDIALAPLVGWARPGWRLGYGGGYFDRTLASLNPRPFTIGVGYQSACLATIFPQPHDIALDVIITEDGVQGKR